MSKHGEKSKKKDRYIPHDYPDEREDFDFIFEVKFGKFLIKNKDANTTELPPPDPNFYVDYNENKHFAELLKCLKFQDHVPKDVQDRISDIVKKYWSYFRENGLAVPIKGYDMVIDTGASPPVNCKKLHYGVHESPIMQKNSTHLLAKLLQLHVQ